MLDQLVESKSNSTENRRRSEFIGVIGVLAVLSLLTLWTVSLFGKDFGMGGDDLSLTTLVAPVPVPDEEPPPEEKKQPEQKVDADVRKELIQNMMDTPVKPPETVSTVKNTVREMRQNVNTILGGSDADTGSRQDAPGRVVQGEAGGINTNAGNGDAETGGGAPPPPPPPVTKPPVPKMVSGGVLNGKATSLPKPAYPPAARAVRAGGAVTVQVVISETGSVISASAVSGHPLLRAAAVAAAQGAHFSPTLLSGQPVKVSGVITYNFVP
ncbi:MAG: TonB family protein [Acidobacteria bacterium]|nr:TonB family protein [Acidobacteriota bacterium]